MNGRRYALLFFLSLTVLGTLLFAVTSPWQSPTNRKVNFGQLQDSDAVVTTGLNRRERAFLGIDYYDGRVPPSVGMFGNHMFMHFSEAAFGDVDRGYFFNSYYGNLSLTELFALISNFSTRKMLPSKAMIVQLTPPNNDNGLHLLGFAGELPLWMILPVVRAEIAGERAGLFESTARLLGAIGDIYGAAISNLYYATSFGSSIEALHDSSRWQGEDRILDTALCSTDAADKGPPERPLWLRAVTRIAGLAGAHEATKPTQQQLCSRRYLSSALRYDGSAPVKYGDNNLVLDENPLDPREADSTHRKITAGDEEEIVLYLRRIAAIGDRNGTKVIFVVPPVYETERDGPGNRVLTRALALAPELNIIDHRHLRSEPRLFVRYDHPSEAYFRLLAAELRQKNLLGH